VSNNMRVVYENYIDTATLSASPAMVATLPEENLQKLSRSRVARTTSLAQQLVLGDLASTKLVSSLVLWRHNLSASATMRLELFDGAGQTGNTVYDSGTIETSTYKSLGDLNWGIDPFEASVFDAWGVYWSVLWFAPAAASSFRITLNDSSNADGYMEITRAILGPYIEPFFNPSYGMRLGWQETSKQERTDGGTLHSDPSSNFRNLEFSLDMLTETDRPKFLEFTRLVGKRKDFFISVFPEVGGEQERDYCMLAKLVQDSSHTSSFYAHFSQALKMQET